jgi:BlaI family transcriptional regulator, penicillinase repressor
VRKGKSQLTPLELQIMKALWESGPSTVQAVQEKLPGERLAYTTVQTILNILQRKGRVRRRLLGKAYEYRAVLSRDKAIREALGDMLNRMFGGSVDALLMTLVKSRQLDADKLAKLQRLIEDRQSRGEVKDERG